VVPGPADARVLINARDNDQDLGGFGQDINVLAPGEEIPFPGSFAGRCAGTMKAWDELVTNFGGRVISPGIVIRRIQNTASGRIILTVFYDTGGSDNFTLTPGESTPALSNRVTRASARPSPEAELAFGGDCTRGTSTVEGIPPGPINVQVFYGCR
jgi:hypothetical protein